MNQTISAEIRHQLGISLGQRSSQKYVGVLGILATVTTAGVPLHAYSQEAALPPIRIEEKVDEPSGYQAKSGTAKLPQDLRDIPQSITVVTSQLIEDRNADTLREALRNVAGLTFNAGEGGRIGDNLTLRGYSVVGDLYLDGMRDVAQYNREVFNLEQIDVLRGSASMLFGRGTTGGLINQVSKQPSLGAVSSIAVTGGSYDYRRATADVNQVINESTAARVTAMYTNDDSFRVGPHYERWGVAPAVKFGIDSNNEFTLAYYRLEDNNIPDYGVPYLNGRPLNVPVTRFYGMTNADYEKNRTGIATATYQHRFSDDTTLKSALRDANYDRDLWAVAPRLASNNTVLNRQRQARGSQEHTITSQTDFSTKFSTGVIQHDLLTGIELTREQSTRWNNLNYTTDGGNNDPDRFACPLGGGPYANPCTSIDNPDLAPNVPSIYFSSRYRLFQARYTSDTIGAYVQDIVHLGQYWQVLLGTRRDQMDADYNRVAPLGPLQRNDTMWSYRSGVIFQPTNWQSYYASYGTSFNPSAEFYQLDDRTANTPPEQSRNIEVGAKFNLLNNNLSLRTSLSRSEKTNERNTDLSNSTEALLSGRRHTDSLEIEAIGRPTLHWEMFAAVAWMRANVDAVAPGSQQLNTLNMTPINTPAYTFSITNTYQLPFGIKVGLTADGAGLRYGNATESNAVPGYTTWDGLVEYEKSRYTVQLNVYNLTDKIYYEGVYAGHTVPGATRTARLMLKYKF
jgi:catecholate siderophore receptor